MSAKNKVLPEIFDIIFTNLDTADLLNAILVCRQWHDNAWHLLWRHLHHPTLSSTFFQQLEKHGHRAQSLALLLDSDRGSHGVVPMELTRVLRHVPRLTSFQLRLSHSGSEETVASLLRVIEDLLSPNKNNTNNNNNTNINSALTKLDLDIGPILQQHAVQFFPAFQVTLRDLTLSGSTRTAALRAIMDTLPGLVSLASHERQAIDIHEGFTDETLQDLGTHKNLPLLKSLAVTANSHVTTAGLDALAAAYQGMLTSIDLTTCITIGAEGIEKLVQQSPLLTHVRLNDTNTGDEVLCALAANGRQGRLRVLSVANCTGVTDVGLRRIVMECSELDELDFSCAVQPLLQVFVGPTWGCRGLSILRCGDQPGRRTATHQITDSERRYIYHQLRRLWRLRELAMDNIGVGLQLWESGRAVIESLRWLEKISLRRFSYTSKDLIWLMTQLPSLRRLVLTEDVKHTDLVEDLRDINKRMEVVLEEMELHDFMDSDDDSDDDNAPFFYNPHPLYDFGLATDSAESEADEEGYSEDDDMASYAGHFMHHVSHTDDDDSDSSSNSSCDHNLHEDDSDDAVDESDEEVDSENRTIGDQESDDDDQIIGYAHSSFGVYRIPYVSDDNQASGSDDNDDDDITISYPYSSFGAYRSFDEDDEDSESQVSDVSDSYQEAEDDEVENSNSDSEDESEEVEEEEEEEEEQEESEVDEEESQYDSDETPPPPYESDSPLDSSDDDDEESIVSDESVEESDDPTPEVSDAEVSEEEEEIDEEEEIEEEEIEEEDDIEEEEDIEEDDIEEEDLDEEVEIDDDEEGDLDDEEEVEEDLDDEEEVEEEEVYYDHEDDINEADFDDEPEGDYDEDPYEDYSDDGHVYEYDDDGSD